VFYFIYRNNAHCNESVVIQTLAMIENASHAFLKAADF